MGKQLCKIARDFNSSIYLLSRRVHDLQDGDYVLDERNEAFKLVKGRFQSLYGLGLPPLGQYDRIEASNNMNMRTKRLTAKFLTVLSKVGQPVDTVVIKIRKVDNTPVTNNKGEVMVKPYRNA